MRINKIQAIRGMNDLLPLEISLWQKLEKKLISILSQYGYDEIRFPLVESTQLFKRSIGEVTDIVEKEMYTFEDLNGDSLTLRPEGTAGCIRACLEHGLLYNQPQKLWYMGPMFRHEKPQKGRYRQFSQFGVEALGISGTDIELELLSISSRIWKNLSLDQVLRLEINTLGTMNERSLYREKLLFYFKKHFNDLDEVSKERLDRNPLRILDSKHSKVKSLLADAPKLLDFIGTESKKQFEAVCGGLEQLKIPYIINPLLVRGLDYYEHTIFEWVNNKLGSQSTVCAGGRYDALIPQLGGEPNHAIGFAIGLERLILSLNQEKVLLQDKQFPCLFIISSIKAGIKMQALLLAEKIREKHPDWIILSDLSESSFKSQFKKADKSHAQIALILGEEEINTQCVGLKNLRQETPQIKIEQSKLLGNLEEYFYP